VRIFLTSVMLVLFYYHPYAQDNPSANQGSDENLKELANNIFEYPTFVEGIIILKDSSQYVAKLNYSRILSKFLVIDRMGNTKPFTDPDTIDKIIVQTDTFYYSKNSFMQKVTHFANVNLYVKQTISYIEKQKGDNGVTPVIISNGSKLPYSFEEPKSENITIEKNSLFRFINEYFIADTSMTFYTAEKKNLYERYPAFKDKLKSFMQEHTVNFNNAPQMEKLLQYLNGL
jgi:hypothetical protein